MILHYSPEVVQYFKKTKEMQNEVSMPNLTDLEYVIELGAPTLASNHVLYEQQQSALLDRVKMFEAHSNQSSSALTLAPDLSKHTLAVASVLGLFIMICSVLAILGCRAYKRRTPQNVSYSRRSSTVNFVHADTGLDAEASNAISPCR